MLRKMEDLFFTGIGAALKGSVTLLNTAKNAVERRNVYAERGRAFVKQAADRANTLRIRTLQAGQARAELLLDRLNIAPKNRVSDLEARLRRVERKQASQQTG